MNQIILLNATVSISKMSIELINELTEILKNTNPAGVSTKVFAQPHLKVAIEQYCSNFQTDSKIEQIYLFINQTSPSVCLCGKQTTFNNITKGYREFCNSNCDPKRKAQLAKRLETQIKNGGVGLQRADSKEKYRKTLTQVYGNGEEIKNISQVEFRREAMKTDNPMKKTEIRQKLAQTVTDKYGTTCVLASEIVKDKIKKTNQLRYGSETVSKNLVVSKRISDSKLSSKYSSLLNHVVEPLFEEHEYRGIHSDEVFYWYCKDCATVFPKRILTLVNSRTIPCPKCTEITKRLSYTGISKEEATLYEFLKSLNVGTILRNYVGLIGETKQEVDFYLPEYNIAIEYNGVFWHSVDNPYAPKDKNYHYNKTKECEKQGVILIHIYSDDWIHKQEIVKQRLVHKFGKSEKIFARKTKVVKLDSKVAREFLNRYHIQGACKSEYYCGLTVNDEILAVMSFTNVRTRVFIKQQQVDDNSFELVRFASKKAVVGGAAKLFRYFVKNVNPEKVISYSMNDWNSGELYSKLGFVMCRETDPGYFYVGSSGIREHRYRYTKKSLVKKGADPSMTEQEIMVSLGYTRIYDSGNKKWVWINPSPAPKI